MITETINFVASPGRHASRVHWSTWLRSSNCRMSSFKQIGQSRFERQYSCFPTLVFSAIKNYLESGLKNSCSSKTSNQIVVFQSVEQCSSLTPIFDSISLCFFVVTIFLNTKNFLVLFCLWEVYLLRGTSVDEKSFFCVIFATLYRSRTVLDKTIVWTHVSLDILQRI